MKRTETKTFLLIALAIGLLAACTNIKKLYREGEVSQNHFYSRIPFDSKLHLMIIPVEINGQTYQFLFDTGAPSVISNEVFQNLGKRSLGKRKAGDSQGRSQKLEFVVIDSLTIGEVKFRHTAALIADLKAAVEINCLKIDGIIGANLMKLAYWKIDPQEETIYCTSDISELTAGLKDPVSLPFRANFAFKPIISLSLDGQEVKSFLWDTGAGDYISMGTDLMKNENILAKYQGLGSTGLYGSKMDTLWVGKTDLTVGSFSQKCEATYKSGNAKRILGMGFMQQFVFILNWQDRRIDLYPQSIEQQFFSKYDAIPRWKDGQLIVGTMRLDSTDIHRHIQVGDTIVAVNGKSFLKANLEDYCDLIFEASEQLTDTLKLEMSDGKIYALPRKKYAIE